MKVKAIGVVFLCLNLAGCASSQKKLMAAREKDPKYHYNVGLFHLNNKNVDEAVRFLNKSLTLDPRNYLALNALGLAFSMKGELNQAIAQFEKCLQIEPSFSEARNNLGSIYQELGLVDKAEQEFLKAADDPNYNTRELPLYNLARLDFTRKDYEKALLRVDMAVKLNVRFAMAHSLRGMILENMERLDEAISSYKSAVKIVPEDVNFNFNLALALMKNKEMSRAKEILEKIAPRAMDPAMREKITASLKQIKEEER